MFAAGKIITRNVARANGIDVTGDVPGKIITRSVTRANQIETNTTGAVKRKANFVIIKNGTMLKRQTTAMNQNAPVLVENRQQIVPRKVVLKAEPTATITSGAATQTTNQTFSELQRLEDGNGIVSNTNAFDCGICFELIKPNDGVIFRNCLHNFCKDCVIQLINQSDDVIVKCPYTSDDYQCSEEIQHREIRALLTNEQFHKFLNREINFAEMNTANSFHCKLPNCPGWCECDENVNNFCCPVCKSNNCINCAAIHAGKNCQEYQDEVMRNASNEQSKESIDQMVNKGDAMRCPKCQIVIVKRDGCDALLCTMCRTQICWATKGFRWGPNGPGDISGGCQCKIDGKMCHPSCRNCH